MVMPYHLHMPSYFLETFTEYPFIGFRYIFYLSRNSFLFQKLNPAYTRTVPNVLVREKFLFR